MAERGQVQPAGGGEGQPSIDAADSDEYGTPQDLFDALNTKRYFTWDVCASRVNAKLPGFWTKEDDAVRILRWALGELPGEAGPTRMPDTTLIQSWWNNPPYSKPNLPTFTRLHRELASHRGVDTTMLVPATPGAAWFQDFVLGGADLLNYLSIDRGPLEGKVLQLSAPLCRIEVNFLRGRLDFVHPSNPHQTSAKTDSALVRFFPRGVNW